MKILWHVLFYAEKAEKSIKKGARTKGKLHFRRTYTDIDPVVGVNC